MAKRFEIGDHVSWNWEAGRVSGTVIAIHTRDFDYKGHVHHASAGDPQYEIKGDKTDHIAAHKGKLQPVRHAFHDREDGLRARSEAYLHSSDRELVAIFRRYENSLAISVAGTNNLRLP